MTTVAVTAANSPVGRALLERLDGDAAVSRVIGIDVEAPPMPVAKLDFRQGDLRDRLLHLLLDEADVLVHLGCDDDLDFDLDSRFARVVSGTRNVVDAAARAGVQRLVHRSSALVYGAHPDNPVPLEEDRPRRANPEYPPAHHHLLAEELVEEFAAAHPNVEVTVLRPATVIGPGEDSVLTRQLETPRLLTVRDREPPRQFVHIDDLAEALRMAALGKVAAGTYNVAADGWLTLPDLCAVLGMRRAAVPEGWAYTVARTLWRRRLWDLPPGGLPVLMEPWVVRSDRLHEAGWTPERSNRELLREFAAEHHVWVRLGVLRLRRRTLRLAAAAAAGLLVAGVVERRRRRRRR